MPTANFKQREINKGVFARDKFIYDKDTDSFICPNNERLNRLPKAQLKNDKKNYSYSASSISCNSLA